jgi:hypothetical protein
MTGFLLKFRWLALLLLLGQLGGCGIISLGYNYSDVYLRYTINSYASFSKEQKAEIHQDVDEFMRWHRKVMLPEYVAFLRALQHKVESGTALSADEVKLYRLRVRNLYVSTLQPTVIPAADLLSGISEAQIREMAESFTRENNKQKDKELSGSEEDRVKLRSERTIDFIENLVGSLNDKQLEQLREANAKLPFATEIYLRLKEDNQKHLLEMLTDKEGKDEVANFLSLWLLMPEKFRKPEEQDQLQAFEQGSDGLIAEIYAMLTERQKNKLLKNITHYADTFQELAKQ